MLRLFFFAWQGEPGHPMPNDSTERTNLSSKREGRFSSSGDGGQEDQTEASHTASGDASPNCILLRSLCRWDLWRVRLCVWSGSRSSIIHFSFCHLLFLGKNCKFQGFWWANFPLYEKMRRTKGQRWDKVGLSRMRNGVGSRLTIGQGSKCIKCERNDNMGDRPVHNSLIILKCLLEGYKIDNLSNE